MKYFCTTEQISLYLQKYIQYRKRKIFFGVSGKLDDKQLIAALTKHAKEKFLFPVSDVHKDDIEVFEQYGIECTKAIMYRTVSNDFTPDEPFDYDMLIFFSPAGVNSLKKNFPDFRRNRYRVSRLRYSSGCKRCRTAPRHPSADHSDALYYRSYRHIPEIVEQKEITSLHNR